MSDPWGAAGDGGGHGGADILIVDNDDRIVELVAWFLKKRGYGVRTAGSFEEARVRIADRLPELMLSDVDLGAENALDELPRLAREGLLPPTLIVSGYLDADTVAALAQNEAVLGTLSKPFDFTVLEERVVECLKGLRQSAPALPGAASAVSAPSVPGEDDDGWIEITPHVPEPPQDLQAHAAPGPEGRRDPGRPDGLVPFRLK